MEKTSNKVAYDRTVSLNKKHKTWCTYLTRISIVTIWKQKPQWCLAIYLSLDCLVPWQTCEEDDYLQICHLACTCTKIFRVCTKNLLHIRKNLLWTWRTQSGTRLFTWKPVEEPMQLLWLSVFLKPMDMQLEKKNIVYIVYKPSNLDSGCTVGQWLWIKRQGRLSHTSNRSKGISKYL